MTGSTVLFPALHIVLTIGILFGFPALAVSAWRSGGRARLIFWAAIALALVAGAAMTSSSARFGNPLSPAMGYWTVTRAALGALGLQLGLPVISATVTAAALGRDRLPYWAVYATVVGAASVGWIAGVLILLVMTPM